MRVIRSLCPALLFAALLICLAPARAASGQPARGPLYTVDVQGTVTSVTVGYMRRALQQAEASGASALIVRLGNSGGVLRDARPLAAEIARARVPVVVYVAPSGTESGAVGALLLSAAHISALTPGTSFGSPGPIARIDDALSQQTRDLVLDSVAEQIRDWNAARGRNAEWVDRAVRAGLVLNNEQAISLSPPAVNMVVADQADLLTRLDGQVVALADGRSAQIATLGREAAPIGPTLWERLRLALADPTVAFLLLVLGALAIYLELAVPGSTLFAGLGAVLLVGSLAGLLVLPIQWWALLLLVFALGLIGAEFFVPTHGGLAVAGLAATVVGALNLIDPAQAPGTVVALWAVLLVAFALATFAALGLWLVLRTRARPVATGQEALLGQLAEVRRRLDPEGMVFVEGALWQAVSEDGVVEAGELVRVAAVHELRLLVRRIDQDSP